MPRGSTPAAQSSRGAGEIRVISKIRGFDFLLKLRRIPIGPTMTVAYVTPIHNPQLLRKHLWGLLKPVWTDRWLKAPRKKKSKPPPQITVAGGHTSIYRVLQKAKYHAR